jgi:hypothetical protein
MVKRRPKPLKPARRPGQRLSHARLEAQRDALLKRMASLHPKLGANRGYRSARVLLNSKYMHASLAARVAVLEAAHFMISMLEMMPPI